MTGPEGNDHLDGGGRKLLRRAALGSQGAQQELRRMLPGWWALKSMT